MRRGAFPVTTQALNGALPELAVARPYAVDLTGWFEGYSHPGVFDANGATSRVAPIVGLGSVTGTPTGPKLNFCSKAVVKLIPHCSSISNLLSELRRAGCQFAKGVLTTGQGDRCPGSMERGPTPSSPAGAGWRPSGALYPESGFPCNPSEVPTGP